MPWVPPLGTQAKPPFWKCSSHLECKCSHCLRQLFSDFPLGLFILFIHCPYTLFFSSLASSLWCGPSPLPFLKVVSWNSLEGLLGFRVKGYVGHEPFTSFLYLISPPEPHGGCIMCPDNTAVVPQHLHCNVLYFANCSGPSNMQPHYTLFPWLQTTDLLRKNVWGVKLHIKNFICVLVNFF